MQVRAAGINRGRFGAAWAVLAGAAALVLALAAPALGQDQSPPAGGEAAVSDAPESKPLGADRAVPSADRRGAGRAADPTKAGAGSGWLSGTALSLGGVVVLIGGAFWVLRVAAARSPALRIALGSQARAPSGVMEVLGRYPVARGISILLLKLDRRILVVSQSASGRLGGGSLATLCEITDPEEVASILVRSRDADGESMSERFRSLLSRFETGHDAAERTAPNGRRTMVGAGGDRAELWDDAAVAQAGGAGNDIPVVDLTARPPLVERPRGLSALRDRLAARGGAEDRRPTPSGRWP